MKDCIWSSYPSLDLFSPNNNTLMSPSPRAQHLKLRCTTKLYHSPTPYLNLPFLLADITRACASPISSQVHRFTSQHIPCGNSRHFISTSEAMVPCAAQPGRWLCHSDRDRGMACAWFYTRVFEMRWDGCLTVPLWCLCYGSVR
jgi:hypothetical protein